MKKIKFEKDTNKYYVVIGSIGVVLITIFLILAINRNARQYLVQKGTLEHTEITTGYIVKKEQTIVKDQTKVLVPVVSEGSRISKGDIIATYKGDEYKNYEDTLERMDREILERMQELPAVYSSEVDAIENTIYSLIKECVGETSYNRMQEYKQKVNSNINKRANIIGSLSPDGAEIKQLIKERNDYESEAKKSNDNILAPMPGIVSYVVDGLEDKLKYSQIDDLDYNSIKNVIDNEMAIDNTKVKVVNNYEAYIVLKAGLENAQYIEEGYNYRLRLIEQDNYEFLGKLERVKKTEDGIETYFKVTNGIENIVGLREVDIEVVWDYATGLIVPEKALNDYDDKQAKYVTAIKQAEYYNIPVYISGKNGQFVVIENYTDEQLQDIGLTSEYDLKLYDRILIGYKN